VIPHAREVYVASRLAVWRRLIHPRVTPMSYLDRLKSRDPEAWRKEYEGNFDTVSPETRKDVEADVKKMYTEFQHRPKYRNWSPDDTF
jgi:hypothetical protein